jgi:cell division protein ZapA
MKPVDIQIMGHDYRVSCPDNGEVSLKAAAQLVDHAMTTIRNAGIVRSRDRIAVLAGINLAYELTQLRAEVQHLRQQVQIQNETVKMEAAQNALCADLISRLDLALGEDGHLL